MRTNHKVWILCSDQSFTKEMREHLGIRYTIETFHTIADFLCKLDDAANELPELLLADMVLQDGYFTDSFKIEEDLFEKIPTLIISSINDLPTINFCFERGVIDYLVKPIDLNEIIFKVEKTLKQIAQKKNQTSLSFQIPRSIRKMLQDNKINLTNKEFRIIDVFINSSSNLVSKQEIINTVWSDTIVSPKVFDVHLSNLRKKIAPLHLNIVYASNGKWTLLNSTCEKQFTAPAFS